MSWDVWIVGIITGLVSGIASGLIVHYSITRFNRKKEEYAILNNFKVTSNAVMAKFLHLLEEKAKGEDIKIIDVRLTIHEMPPHPYIDDKRLSEKQHETLMDYLDFKTEALESMNKRDGEYVIDNIEEIYEKAADVSFRIINYFGAMHVRPV